jgi:trans-2,3-dihydro-3-hydroxyanthranilate isomerase
MTANPFYIVNVFAEEKYAGNHLTVVRDGQTLSAVEMQKIAREIGPAAFILSDQRIQPDYKVRVFTPAREIFFCGHPVVGAAYVIQQELVRQPVQTLQITLPGGSIALTLQYKDSALDTIIMPQPEAIFGKIFPIKDIITLLHGIGATDIDERYPIQEVSTGLPFITVPLKTLAALQRVRIAKEQFAAFTQELEAKTILLFSPETYKPEHHFHVRVFADYYGVPEDPATGSANGCLGAYLVQYRYLGSEHIEGIRVEQGHALERPSLLQLTATKHIGKIAVSVGGRVLMVAKGSLV